MAERLRIRDVTLPDHAGEGAFVLDIEDGRIIGVESTTGAAPDPPAVVSAAGLLATAGLIDLQVNGAAGYDLTRDPSSIWTVGAALVRHGVTAFLPTIITAAREVSEAARAVLVAGPPPGYAGARPLGLHVEGPFLSPDRRGAHDPALLRDPDLDFVRDWEPVRGVALVTLAPELPGAEALIRALVGRGIAVAIGHTNATAGQARAGFAAGATAVTHLFNAMPGLDHRAPGPIGVALADPRVTVCLIPDGIHVDPLVVDLSWRLAGPNRLAVVTDAMAALDMPPGRYPLGRQEVIVDGTSARLEDGRLAGSVLGLDGAVRNLRAFTGCSIADAVAAATRTPARLLGVGDRRGSLRAGAMADIALFGPDLTLAATIVGGQLVHAAAGAPRWA